MLQRIEVDLESIMTDQEICPLCNEGLINRAVAVDCEHAFCHACLQEHLESSNRCPTCRQVVERFVTKIDRNLVGHLFQLKVKDEEEEEAYDEDKCTVCLEKSEERTSVDGCNHSFCYSCIRSWSRKSGRCPLCKKRFSKIIYYAYEEEEDEKEEEDNEDDDAMDVDGHGVGHKKVGGGARRTRCESDVSKTRSQKILDDLAETRKVKGSERDLNSIMRRFNLAGEEGQRSILVDRLSKKARKGNGLAPVAGARGPGPKPSAMSANFGMVGRVLLQDKGNDC